MRTHASSARFVERTFTHRTHSTWPAARPGRAGASLPIAAESLCDAAGVRSSDHVLDAMAGTGDVALAAARRFADVTAVAESPSALEHVSRRAEAESLFVVTRDADAEALPFPAATFDVALSAFGVAGAEDPRRAAGEIVRVVRPDGRIGLSSWTPDGFIAGLRDVLARFRPDARARDPLPSWGTRAGLQELFGVHARAMRIERRTHLHRHRSPGHWIADQRRDHGLLKEAFEPLGLARRRALHATLVDLLSRFDRGGGEALLVPADYLEVVMRRA